MKHFELNSDSDEEIYDFEAKWDDTKRFDEAEWNKQKQYLPMPQSRETAQLWDDIKAATTQGTDQEAS